MLNRYMLLTLIVALLALVSTVDANPIYFVPAAAPTYDHISHLVTPYRYTFSYPIRSDRYYRPYNDNYNHRPSYGGGAGAGYGQESYGGSGAGPAPGYGQYSGGGSGAAPAPGYGQYSGGGSAAGPAPGYGQYPGGGSAAAPAPVYGGDDSYGGGSYGIQPVALKTLG